MTVKALQQSRLLLRISEFLHRQTFLRSIRLLSTLCSALKEDDRKALAERITTRHGLRQLSYMKEMGMGNDRYHLIDIDNGDVEISLEEAVKDVVPFEG